ncbi:tRNA (adenosine(37)-N6)-dimethylallyltransferase MiaA [Tepidibacter formicigenes]|jgi:tRNA dimethylallyltransferase|uniref:tRNA dimethylallyltransferase n=1 Tax=Tepidibacter formicigenes DSM 15518 TaxID=1123349 RepID=A0A1M6M5P8_9FIRM|nr:tRNA (adenosine(37)-N6)-dimethylallyltransferase MiaA [Tepidibacter formicigenes]SHJ78660.1 tRNA dimethylallyltransferase [Tepidibacter formicigenes DSM 15518]
MSKIPLIIIAGPTAVGKTDLSIEIAKSLNTDIISADSMQIYKYMDIGTAKITEDEMQGVKHYLIDEVTPDTEFSVAEFQSRAKKYINEIYSKGKIPLIAGGTGLYINSLIYEMDFTDSKSNYDLREKLQKEADEYGVKHLHEKLKELDSDSASRIHPNNVKRVIRALEVCLDSNDKIGDFKRDLKLNENYHPIFIVLNRDRNILYERINKRVDIMISSGLVEEVKKLMNMGYTEDMTSMKAIGYKEIIKHLNGKYSLDEAIYIIKRDSRRYAKRQITWFKRYDIAKWFDLDEYKNLNEIKSSILSFIEGNLKSL